MIEYEICPFCQSEFGCCFCDYSGRVSIGKGEMFKAIKDYEIMYESINNEFLQERADLKVREFPK